MQSSSQLFPVALLSAELRGDLTEDVYRLKPNNSPDSSVELAVTRLGLPDGRRGVPVILRPGAIGADDNARVLGRRPRLRGEVEAEAGGAAEQGATPRVSGALAAH